MNELDRDNSRLSINQDLEPNKINEKTTDVDESVVIHEPTSLSKLPSICNTEVSQSKAETVKMKPSIKCKLFQMDVRH